jgi:hypothetical protein
MSSIFYTFLIFYFDVIICRLSTTEYTLSQAVLFVNNFFHLSTFFLDVEATVYNIPWVFPVVNRNAGIFKTIPAFLFCL